MPFRFTLPQPRPEPDNAAGLANVERVENIMMWLRSGRTVLIVASEPEALALNSGFLYQPQIRVLNTRPDWRGLHLARRKQPSLIIEDLCLPDRDPLSFCRDLRSDPATSSIPLILLADPELREEAGRARADALLAKPVPRREYYDAVRRFIPLPNRRSRRVPINLRFTWSCDGRLNQAFTRDVSLEGAFIKSDRPLPVGELFVLHFSLPGTSEVLSCDAVVRYVTPRNGGGADLAGFGIEFVSMPDPVTALLELFVASKLARCRIAR